MTPQIPFKQLQYSLGTQQPFYLTLHFRNRLGHFIIYELLLRDVIPVDSCDHYGRLRENLIKSQTNYKDFKYILVIYQIILQQVI